MQYQFITYKKAHYILVCLFFVFMTACDSKSHSRVKTVPLLEVETHYKRVLENCIQALDSLDNNLDQVSYIKARDAFKQAEPILSFVDKENYKALNAPNILKVEEEDATDIKITTPFGFQVIEEQLAELPIDKDTTKKTIAKTKHRLSMILQNTHLKLKDYHLLWLIRDEVARVALTGITGFDSPVYERSLEEAMIVYKEMQTLLAFYKPLFNSEDLYNKWVKEIQNTIKSLKSDFSSFDRYAFIKKHTHKQLELIIDTRKDWNVEFPYELAFNNEMISLFSEETFNMDFFSDLKSDTTLDKDKAALGKALFNDVRLSRDNTMSCATCHQESLAFTDGLKAFPKLKRNSPTLAYSALQQSFFYDGRAGSVEGQIVGVVENKNEFHTDLETLIDVVKSDSIYKAEMYALYGDIDDFNIRNAIASYLRTLNKFNSKFDRNINNLEHTLTDNEINGFNLFTGKAKCATCHFAPVFNGTVPPNFTESEFELLGVPQDTINAIVSQDLGRYDVFKTEERKHFFKTPTIRNISKTAPYMHNGVYETLEQVMTFYNDGGGAGLSIALEHQTLPPDVLNLTDDEISDIIAFMRSLEDN